MSWLDEVVIEPDGRWLTMGTRALGDRSWLSGDRADLDQRRVLLDRHFDDVVAAPRSAAPAVGELARLVAAETTVGEPPSTAEPIEVLAWLGRSVAEDFCLLRRGSRDWEFEAGVVCFPSRWRLRDKLGLGLWAVHDPVDGYDPVLVGRVTSLLDRLGRRVVMRRNWFVHPDPALFQPERPVDGDRFVPASEVLDGLFVRSERQTLRSLPRSGRVVFAITTQQCSLRELVSDAQRRDRFVELLRRAPADRLEHRGLSTDQTAAVLAALIPRSGEPQRQF